MAYTTDFCCTRVMRINLLLLLLFSLELAAQESRGLLVSSIKGTATVTENNQESRIKIEQTAQAGCDNKNLGRCKTDYGLQTG